MRLFFLRQGVALFPFFFFLERFGSFCAVFLNTI
jgi:hypothetical protein